MQAVLGEGMHRRCWRHQAGQGSEGLSGKDRAMSTFIKDRIELAVSRLNRAIEELQPIAVLGLFSGGHDSFTASLVAERADQFDGIVHINTGIGVEATRQYVRDTCTRQHWPLFEYRATENTNSKGQPDPKIYEEIVRMHGFPGPYAHRMMYTSLKQRQLQKIEREFEADLSRGHTRRVLYVSGCRTEESVRRMANTEEVQIEGRRIWCAPIHDFTKLDTTEALQWADQPRNPVVDLIHKSGECLCGAYAKKGELAELGLWDITREAHSRLVKLESEIKPKFGWGWEDGPPVRRWKPTWTNKMSSLCWSCDKAAEQSEPLCLCVHYKDKVATDWCPAHKGTV